MSNNEWQTGPTNGRGPDDTPPRIEGDWDATVVVPRMGEAPPAPQSSQPPPPSAAPPAQPPPPTSYGQAPSSGQPPGYGQAPPYGQPPGYAPGYGNPQFGAPAATGTYRSPGGAITMIAGASLAIVGTFLPWVTFGSGGFSDSVDGYETYFIGDDFDAVEWANPGGYVVGAMLIVIVMAIVILAAGRSTATWILGILAAGFAGLMTLGAFGAVGSVLNQDIFGSLTIGIGIVVCMLGAMIAGAGAVIVAAKKS